MRRPILALAVVLVVAGCKKSEQATPETSAPPSTAPTASAAPNPLDVIMTKSTVADALAVAAPLLQIEKPNDSSPGTFLFALWGLEHLKWNDVAPTRDETSYARVQKDVDAERTKRLCTSGVIIQIQATKQPYGTLYVGLLMNDAENLYHFNAVKSSGDLVQRSTARFCGFVTGKYDYANSAGGEGHAIDMVGMFDLPENRATSTAPTPATPRQGRGAANSTGAAADGPRWFVSCRCAAGDQACADSCARTMRRTERPGAPPQVAPAPAPVPAKPAPCGCRPGDLVCATRCSTEGH